MLATWGPRAILIVLCGLAAWLDLTQRRIPNWLCAATAVIGLAAALALGGVSDLGSHALHAFLALLGGMVLFAMGGFGGGDAKFYAGAACWFGLKQAPQLLVSITLAGLTVLAVWFLYRRVRRLPISRKKSDTPFDDLPYGIGIGLGAVLAIMN
jgi:prepilin peptidase CpaA